MLQHPGLTAHATPRKLAAVMCGTGEGLTYAALEARSNQLAHLLRAAGLHAGDHLAILLENHLRYFEVCWAAQRAGLYFTTINWHLSAAEAAYIIDDCGARVLVTSLACAAAASAIVPATPRIERRLMIDGVVPGYESYEQALAAFPALPIADESEGAMMLYSSGTTGQSKGIIPPTLGAPYGTMPLVHDLNRRTYGVDGETVYLSPAPLYHSAPLNFCLMVQRLGGTAVVMERFDAAAALRGLARHRVTHSQWVPTMFVRLLMLSPEERALHDLTHHRVAIHAAAPCPVPVKEAMIAWWGPILWEYYSATERPGITVLPPAEWAAHQGSVGRAVLGDLHVVADDGHECAPFEIGTVYFANGPQFVYHGDPAATAASRNPAGWTTVGDIGYADGDGYLYLTDRKAFMIISGGVNVYPQEAENVLASHPGVLDVAVFGIPHPEFGEAVHAVVQLVDPGAACPELAQALIAACRAHLAHFKCPRSIEFAPELPRLPTGKLAKQALRDRYWSVPAPPRA